MSEILDDERRDVFLQTLQSLHEQKETDTNHEAEILRAQQEELERGRREAETKRQEDLKAAEATGHSPQRKNNHKRSNSEKDYGIDDPSPTTKRPPEANGVRGFRPTQHHLSHSSRRPPTSKQPPPAGVYKKGLELVHALQRLLFNTAQSMSKNPTILLRMVLFVLALVITLSRRGVRERVGRITVVGWDKIKRTFGMGVKVSYV